MKPAILDLKFPFELKKDQLAAVDSWVLNAYRGSIIYSTGTGKTEIAFECARRRANENYFYNNGRNDTSDRIDFTLNTFPSILFLVPRITLVEQNLRRFLSYRIPRESLGVFFGERKEVKEITISTYQSIINNLELIRNADTIIFLLPPVKKYMVKDAVQDGRLAKPILIPIKAKLTVEEKNLYHTYTNRIRKISNDLNISDPQSMAGLLRKGGISAKLASSWFENVRNRKNLINSAENKISAAVELISMKHPSERIMVFSETIESIKKLKKTLEDEKGIKSMIIESKLKSKERQEILSKWGADFYALLSVHTLEIGYDVPQVRIAIIMASTSNMNQAAQRVGRILRKSEGKHSALIYTVYLSDTHDYAHLDVVRQATRLDGNKQEIESRIKGNSQTSVNTRNTKLDSFTG